VDRLFAHRAAPPRGCTDRVPEAESVANRLLQFSAQGLRACAAETFHPLVMPLLWVESNPRFIGSDESLDCRCPAYRMRLHESSFFAGRTESEAGKVSPRLPGNLAGSSDLKPLRTIGLP